ncbi:TspO/MBR family protein [Roseobacter sp. HKCCA0434]|uniref:TspO/MBR family protein n=1 Tax=Roseobacter sp. HKCCA0434 TaxID=3079297 RepID=UPI002905F631|nr:TspO/MBR family protein [Roseobacter sp. HKCCA0434]
MRLAILLLAIAFAVSPFFSDFNGFDPDLYPVPQENPPIQPAGWAFSIWGVIYLALIVHGLLGLRHERWQASRLPLAISLAVGVIWLPVAGGSPVWATILIWVMLIGAVAALLRDGGRGDLWSFDLPVGLYAGWLSAASFVSLALLGAGWGIGPGATGWAWIMLPLAVAFAAFVQWRVGVSPFYGIAVAWGLFGISARNLGPAPLLAAAAILGIVVVAGVIVATRSRKSA